MFYVIHQYVKLIIIKIIFYNVKFIFLSFCFEI